MKETKFEGGAGREREGKGEAGKLRVRILKIM